MKSNSTSLIKYFLFFKTSIYNIKAKYRYIINRFMILFDKIVKTEDMA